MKKPTTPLSACLFLLFCIFQWSATQAQGENSLSFDGVDDYVTCPNASAQIASSTGMSLSCWVYATNPSPSYPNFDGFAGFRNEINCDFSNRSAICPAVAEKRKNGNMKRIAARLIMLLELIDPE